MRTAVNDMHDAPLSSILSRALLFSFGFEYTQILETFLSFLPRDKYVMTIDFS